MKKKIFGAVAAIAIAGVVTFNLNMNTDNNEFSTLNLDNVEALASGESGGKSCDSNWSGIYCGTFIPAEGTPIMLYEKGFYD